MLGAVQKPSKRQSLPQRVYSLRRQDRERKDFYPHITDEELRPKGGVAELQTEPRYLLRPNSVPKPQVYPSSPPLDGATGEGHGCLLKGQCATSSDYYKIHVSDSEKLIIGTVKQPHGSDPCLWESSRIIFFFLLRKNLRNKSQVWSCF